MWLISDTHFGHTNIIKYCNRPFQDADEMDDYIIARWRECIQPEDVVYHLGDLAFHVKGDSEIYQARRERLRTELTGKIRLIQGNHDKVSAAWLFKYLGIQSIAQRKGIQLKSRHFVKPAVLLKVTPELPVLLSHRPLDEFDFGYYEQKFNLAIQLNVHGHIHNNAWTLRREYAPDRAWFNVSVEVTEYKPIHISKIIKLTEDIYNDHSTKRTD